LPTECDGSQPSTWRVSGTFAGSASEIKFGDVSIPFDLLTATASLGKFSSPRFGWSASATGVFGGHIEHRSLDGGAALGGAVTYLPLFETERRPFVALTGNGSFAFIRAPADDGMTRTWTAVDFRVGAMVGKSLLEQQLVLYGALRAFAGPVSWRRGGEAVTGGDRYHVTLGAGASWRATQRLTFSIEGMPLGERSFAAGATWNL
jgi:hypothetical protein